MTNVEAFKNELRNYKYYISVLKQYEHIYNGSKTDDDDSVKLLKPFNKKLDQIQNEIDTHFYKMTGVGSVPFDKEASGSTNESATMNMKLEQIEKYNKLLKNRKIELKVARKVLETKIKRFKNNIENIEQVLNGMPKDLKNACIRIYCENKTYEDVANDGMYMSPSVLFYQINKSLEDQLNGVD